jgi:hypothetical protein
MPGFNPLGRPTGRTTIPPLGTTTTPPPAGSGRFARGPNGRLMIDGQEMDSHNDPRMYGSFGRFQEPGSNSYGYTDESGNVISDSRPTLTPAQLARLAGRVQLPQGGLGGYSEGLDPSQFEWDDEFGVLTQPGNVGRIDDANSNRWGSAIMAALIGANVGMINATGGFGTGGGATNDPYSGIPEDAGWDFNGIADNPALTPPGGGPPGGGPEVSGPPAPEVTGSGNIGTGPGGTGTASFPGMPAGFDIGRFLSQYGMRGLSLLGPLLGGGGNGSGTPGRGGGGGGGMGSLLDLLLAGGARAAGNRNENNYRDDMNNLINIGTAGVTNDDRAGARNLVRGVYDGSISGEEVYNRVPGLRAQADRMAADRGRVVAAGGDGSPIHENARWMREFQDRDYELVSNSWNNEMNRAAQIGGYNFNPGQVTGQVARAYGDMANQRTQDDSALFSNLARALSGNGNTTGQGLWNLISDLFGGGGAGDGFWNDVANTPDTDLPEINDNTDNWWDTYGDDPFAGP